MGGTPGFRERLHLAIDDARDLVPNPPVAAPAMSFLFDAMDW